MNNLFSSSLRKLLSLVITAGIASAGLLEAQTNYPGTNTFAVWAETNGVPANANGPTDDPDADGLPNIMEYAFSLNPNVADHSRSAPHAQLLSLASQTYLTLSYRCPKPLPGDLTYIVESSSELEIWTAIGTLPVGPPVDMGDHFEVTVRMSQPITGASRGFLRLSLSPEWSKIRIPWGSTFWGVNAVEPSLVGAHALKTLAEDWKVNTVRLNLRGREIQFIQDDISPYDLNDADLWELDRYVDFCESCGVRVILGNHRPLGQKVFFMPGGTDRRIWADYRFHDYLIFFWRKLAARYANRGPVIAGYDIFNEPDPDVQVAGTPSDWNQLALKITQAIREVDKVHPIIVESIGYANPARFSVLEPTGDDNTVYSFHFYSPIGFTHQGLGPPYPAETNVAYPGWIMGEFWDTNRMAQELLPVLDFAQSNNVPIYAGEFSVAYWAPPASAVLYLNDVTTLFSSNNWSWSYWSYHEGNYAGAWNLEYEGSKDSPVHVGTNSARFQALWPWFSRNQKWIGPRRDRPATRPRILFDEFHAERGTISPERAMQLDPIHPEWYLWRDFLERVETYYDVTRSTGALTAEMLHTNDMVILAAPQSALSPDEVAAVLGFVNDGGGLLVVGDASMGSQFNGLLQNFGMAYTNVPICSDHPDWDAQSFKITQFNQTQPICQGVSEIQANWSGLLAKVGDAVVLCQTGSDTWADRNWDGLRQPNEESGPFAFDLAAEHGAGRVVAVADNTFNDTNFIFSQNGIFMMHVLYWLATPRIITR